MEFESTSEFMRGGAYSDVLKSALMSKMVEQDTGATIKTTIYIILVLIICSCSLICFTNGFDMSKIFSSFTVDLLFLINSLTLIAVVLALMYGFHSVAKDPTKYTDMISSLPQSVQSIQSIPTAQTLTSLPMQTMQSVPSVTSSIVPSMSFAQPMGQTMGQMMSPQSFVPK